MKIRQLKKLVKQYPPMIVIRIPSTAFTPDRCEGTKYAIQKIVPAEWKVFIIPYEEIRVKGFDVSSDKLKELVDSFNQTGVMCFDDATPKEYPSHLEIIHIVKDGVLLYKKRVQQLEQCIERLHLLNN